MSKRNQATSAGPVELAEQQLEQAAGGFTLIERKAAGATETQPKGAGGGTADDGGDNLIIVVC